MELGRTFFSAVTGPWYRAGLLALISVFPAQAAVADQCIQPDELKIQTLDRSFVQERFLAGMAAPLRSEGRLQVVPDKITWHMTKPFDVATVLTPTSITQSVDGGPPQPTGPDGSDLSASIARIFGSLLQGRWSELQSVFQVARDPVPTGAPWSVSLAPIDPQMQKILGKIEVLGCTDISTIRIDHQNGDHDVITFAPAGAPAP